MCQQACPLGALNQPYVLNKNTCLSYLLQVEHLPEEAQTFQENRVGDCEICQHACPWNKKHHDNPLVTNMTESFQKNIKGWENFFYLPNLVELSEKGYRETLGPLNTSIPYNIFQRNVLIAMERVKKVGEMANKPDRPYFEDAGQFK